MSSPTATTPASRSASGQSLSGTTIIRPRPIDVFPGSFALGVHEQQQRQYAAYPVPPSRASSLHLPSVSMKEKEELMMYESETEDKPMMTALGSPSEGLGIIRDVFSWKDWANPLLWKAGIVEAVASCCFNFLTGLIPMTLSQWPVAAIPAGIFVANSTAVSLLIFALSTATGAHINPNISISTTLSGLCHPVRMIVYVLCQTAGGAVGGAMLRVGVGLEKALATHNGGCWLEPEGPMTVGQAVMIEFMSVFSLLLICYGVGLDPRQAQLYGAAMGPILIGVTIGFLTAITATISPGYTGAGMFPGRCFGLAVGIGELQSTHWIWWVPDFAATVAHTILYRFAPPYVRETVHIDLGEPPKKSKKSKKPKTPTQ